MTFILLMIVLSVIVFLTAAVCGPKTGIIVNLILTIALFAMFPVAVSVLLGITILLVAIAVIAAPKRCKS